MTSAGTQSCGRAVTSLLSLEDFAAPRGLTRAELMTATEVAELLDAPVSTIREWGRNGTLPRVKLGRHVRFIRRRVESATLRAEEVRRSDQVGAGPGNSRQPT